MSCCHLASVYQEIKEVNPSNAFVTSSSGSNEYFMVLRCPGVSLSDSYIIYTSTLIGTVQAKNYEYLIVASEQQVLPESTGNAHFPSFPLILLCAITTEKLISIWG